MTGRAALYRAVRAVQGDRRFGILSELRTSETRDPESLREVQAARLAALLRHAAEHVPHYRAPLIESGVVLPGKTGRVDLTRFTAIPILERATIREQSRALQDSRPAEPDNPRFERGSGGTTGTRLRLVQDRVTHEHSGAVTLWFDEWCGHALGKPKVVVWEIRRRSLAVRLGDRLGRFLKNEEVLPINVLFDATLDRYLRIIDRRRPSLLVGYTGAVYQLARRAEETGIDVGPPRVVMVSAEALAEGMRETIERAFRAPVVNRYGALETGGIACECLHRRGLHVSPVTHHVEILRPDGTACEPGEIGDVVVTLLTNYSMPLIRYRIGDRAATVAPGEPCPCGRRLPRLQAVVGRTLDAFRRRDGAWVHGVNVKRFYHRTPWIHEFQVVQLDIDRVLVRLVDRERRPDPLQARRSDLMAITEYLRGLLGAGCEVAFEFVERVSRAPSGKYRLTMRLAPNGDATDPAEGPSRVAP